MPESVKRRGSSGPTTGAMKRFSQSSAALLGASPSCFAASSAASSARLAIAHKDMGRSLTRAAGGVDLELRVLVDRLGSLQALRRGQLARLDVLGVLDEPLGLGAQLGRHRGGVEDDPAVLGG